MYNEIIPRMHVSSSENNSVLSSACKLQCVQGCCLLHVQSKIWPADSAFNYYVKQLIKYVSVLSYVYSWRDGSEVKSSSCFSR